MPKNNVSKFINNHFVDSSWQAYFTKDGYQSFRTYLGNVEKGNSHIYKAPFAKGVPMEKILNDWNRVLVSISTQWPTLWEFEQEMRSKVGPLSVQKPLRDRISDIASYYDDVMVSAKPVADEAIKAAKVEFLRLRDHIRPRAEDRTVDLMKKSTNSGNPYFTKRRNVVQDTVPCEIWGSDNPVYYHSYVEQQLHGGNYEAAAIIGWRGQEGGPEPKDVKQRVIWMFPFAVNIKELQVYQPLIEACQKCRLVPAWVSMDLVDEEVTKLFDTKSSDDLVVCTDFSRFDQHFNGTMQETAKTMLEYVLNRQSKSDIWLRDVFPIKYYIPILWQANSNGVSAFHGRHGMASGSGGTNVDETLAHRVLQHEAAVLKGSKLNPHSMCLGDDGILSYPGITINDVVRAYESHGQECNVSKQYASTQDCVYLRRWHHTNYRESNVCVGVYSTNRALGRLRYLERFMDPDVWSPEMVALRQLSIVENCNHHPLKEQFAQFCMKRDKYRLGIDIPGFLDNIAAYAKEATDYMPDFLGYTKTLQGQRPDGITEWWIVKYLNSQR